MCRKSIVVFIQLMILCIVCTACSNTPENEEYKESRMLSPLIIPEGLDQPVKSDVMAIPDVPVPSGKQDVPLSELLLPPVFIPEEGAASEEELNMEKQP